MLVIYFNKSGKKKVLCYLNCLNSQPFDSCIITKVMHSLRYHVIDDHREKHLFPGGIHTTHEELSPCTRLTHHDFQVIFDADRARASTYTDACWNSRVHT